MTCTRCGGTGTYKYNTIDGDTCYGCNGTGKRMTEKVAHIDDCVVGGLVKDGGNVYRVRFIQWELYSSLTCSLKNQVVRYTNIKTGKKLKTWRGVFDSAGDLIVPTSDMIGTDV